ncbi:MAG: hypothetical protein KGL61_04970 [Burkholderiales bacterium]|nr:hypothetical protein [Burkholderiales bacterium]
MAVAPDDVSVSTPVAPLYDAAMLPYVAELVFVNPSTSSPEWKLPVIATVAEPSVVAAVSVTVNPESIATGVDVVLSPATNAAEPESVVTCTGFTTLIVSVAAALVFAPSFVAKEIVRLPGVALAPAENVTADSALAHCASVAVAPEDVSVNTPVPELYEAAMLPNVAELVLLNASVSPLWKPLVTDTVPDNCVVLSRSLTVMPLSIVTAGAPPA